jgi:YfiH family protein
MSERAVTDEWAVSGWKIIAPDWAAPAGVRAAFTLRTGGVSGAPYDSLNVGAHVGDVSAAVAENRRLVRERLRLPGEPVWLQQVHGAGVVELDGAGAHVPARHADAGAELARLSPAGAEAESPLASGFASADAAVTRAPGRVCVIQVADCMPVLFAARDGSAVGAAHAGWRGLAGGVLEETVRALGVPAADLIAWLGPTIGQPNFEVGDEVRAAFVSHDPDAVLAFEANARGRWQCDLYSLARRRLAAVGIREVSGGGWCTYADAARFFSYRRDGQCGRMAALIWMECASVVRERGLRLPCMI